MNMQYWEWVCCNDSMTAEKLHFFLLILHKKIVQIESKRNMLASTKHMSSSFVSLSLYLIHTLVSRVNNSTVTATATLTQCYNDKNDEGDDNNSSNASRYNESSEIIALLLRR